MFTRLHLSFDSTRIQDNPTFSYLKAQLGSARPKALRYVYDVEADMAHTTSAEKTHGEICSAIGIWDKWLKHDTGRNAKKPWVLLDGFIRDRDMDSIHSMGLIPWIKERHAKADDFYIGDE